MAVIGVTTGRLSLMEAAKHTIRLYLPNYIVSAARRYAAERVFDLTPDTIEDLLAAYVIPFRPRGVTTAKGGFEEWQVDALPHVQVLTSGYDIIGRDQNGYRVGYTLEVASLVGAQSHDDTQLIAALYEDGLIGCLGQPKRAEDGGPALLWDIAASVELAGGGQAVFDHTATSRTFEGTAVVCQCEVAGVLDPWAGPVGPDPLPDGLPPIPGDLPTVEEGGATVVYEPEEI